MADPSIVTDLVSDPARTKEWLELMREYTWVIVSFFVFFVCGELFRRYIKKDKEHNKERIAWEAQRKVERDEVAAKFDKQHNDLLSLSNKFMKTKMKMAEYLKNLAQSFNRAGIKISQEKEDDGDLTIILDNNTNREDM